MGRGKFGGDGLPGATSRALAGEVGGLLGMLVRLGRAGGVALLIFGLLCFTFGLFFSFATWLGLIPLGFGLMLAAAGVSILRQPNFAALAGEVSVGRKLPRAELLGEVERSAPPFWICADCNIYYAASECLGRCAQCGQTSGLVHVENAEDQRLAIASLS